MRPTKLNKIKFTVKKLTRVWKSHASINNADPLQSTVLVSGLALVVAIIVLIMIITATVC